MWYCAKYREGKRTPCAVCKNVEEYWAVSMIGADNSGPESDIIVTSSWLRFTFQRIRRFFIVPPSIQIQKRRLSASDREKLRGCRSNNSQQSQDELNELK